MRKVTNKNVGRKSSVPKRVFEKTIVLKLVGGNKANLQKAAHNIHKAVNSQDLTVGGKVKRDITVTHESTEPKEIFHGRI